MKNRESDKNKFWEKVNMKKTINTSKISLILVIVIAAFLLITINKKEEAKYKQVLLPQQSYENFEATPQEQKVQATTSETTTQSKIEKNIKNKTSVPKLVDLGAGKCIPCKMMAPILDELKQEFKGKFDVEVIDVWEHPEIGEVYRIRLIPTQIFFDEKDKELYRHEGFMSKQDILNKWKELGYDFGK